MELQSIFEKCLEGTIHEGKQVDEHGVHLTVGALFSIIGPGKIDFGGDEHRPCETEKLPPEKSSEDDDYGWWELEGGHYLLRFNESVAAGCGSFLVLPNERILSCGCTVASVSVRSGSIKTILSVPSPGVSIKENARIALLCRNGQ